MICRVALFWKWLLINEMILSRTKDHTNADHLPWYFLKWLIIQISNSKVTSVIYTIAVKRARWGESTQQIRQKTMDQSPTEYQTHPHDSKLSWGPCRACVIVSYNWIPKKCMVSISKMVKIEERNANFIKWPLNYLLFSRKLIKKRWKMNTRPLRKWRFITSSSSLPVSITSHFFNNLLVKFIWLCIYMYSIQTKMS